MRAETLRVVLQRTTSINDWCSSRGTSITHTHARTHTDKTRHTKGKDQKKTHQILQEAPVTESTVASISQNLTHCKLQQYLSVRHPSPIYGSAIQLI